MSRTLFLRVVAVGLFTCISVGAVAPRREGKPGRAPSARAVWMHAPLFGREEASATAKMRTTLDDYRRAGITLLFCFSALPDEHGLGWDFLRTLLREAHARGIQVQPVLSPGYAVPLEGEVKQHPEWLITGTKGEIYRNLNLSHPGARQYFLSRVAIALQYDVDGIHLDYTRFPLGQSFSYDGPTIAAFKASFGESPLDVSRDAGNMIWCEWVAWNGRQVTALVREVREAVKKRNPRLALSAAVFPNPALAAYEVGQDWESWARDGLVDVLCPMLYTNNTALFRQYVRRAVAIAAGHCDVYAGIACVSSHNKNTPAGVIEQTTVAGE
ncbi:MAG: glycoside hydrolase family 10 protein, partial [Bacteroidales bacterium]